MYDLTIHQRLMALEEVVDILMCALAKRYWDSMTDANSSAHEILDSTKGEAGKFSDEVWNEISRRLGDDDAS